MKHIRFLVTVACLLLLPACWLLTESCSTPSTTSDATAQESTNEELIEKPTPYEDKHLTVGFHRAKSMLVQREYPGGYALKDGRVLVVSGHPLIGGKSIKSAELYDYKTDTWTFTGPLPKGGRNGGGGGVLLKDGRLLLCGGHNNTEGALSRTSIFDPKKGVWEESGEMNQARGLHATILLQDGRVLAFGGLNYDTNETFRSAEIFDPKTGKWTLTGSMKQLRSGHRIGGSVFLLSNGSVLVLGGFDDKKKYLVEVERYNPKTGKWTSSKALDNGRVAFAGVKLKTGNILVIGGRSKNEGGGLEILKTVLLYNPDKDEWSSRSSMEEARSNMAVTLLANGHVLVTGGRNEGGVEYRSAEIYSPSTDTWKDAGDMFLSRRHHAAPLLPNGRVLIIGGSNAFGAHFLKEVEIYQP